jgi:hypothetical protein
MSDAEFLINITNKFLNIACLTIIPIGITLNLINIFIFSRNRLNKTLMGFYYTALSITSIVVLVMNFIYFYGTSLGNSFSLIHDLTCRLGLYFIRVCVQVASWLHVLIALDRTIMVKYPQNQASLNFLKNKNYLLIVILIMVIILLTINIPTALVNLSSYAANSNFSSNYTITNKTCSGSDLILFMGDMITFLSRTLIPFTVMAVLDVMIVSVLTRSKKKLLTRNSKTKSEFQFAFTVFFFNIVLFFFYLKLNLQLENQKKKFSLRYFLLSFYRSDLF